MVSIIGRVLGSHDDHTSGWRVCGGKDHWASGRRGAKCHNAVQFQGGDRLGKMVEKGGSESYADT